MKRVLEGILFACAFGMVCVLFLHVHRADKPVSVPPVPVRVVHGGCRLEERLGPEVHVCGDGSVWHRKVDGSEYMGNMATVRPLLVPAA